MPCYSVCDLLIAVSRKLSLPSWKLPMAFLIRDYYFKAKTVKAIAPETEIVDVLTKADRGTQAKEPYLDCGAWQVPITAFWPTAVLVRVHDAGLMTFEPNRNVVECQLSTTVRKLMEFLASKSLYASSEKLTEKAYSFPEHIMVD